MFIVLAAFPSGMRLFLWLRQLSPGCRIGLPQAVAWISGYFPTIAVIQRIAAINFAEKERLR
ncbi:MAG: hypothetical protein JO200_08790 [Comamonas sp.]|nr:hypothetical protein [Comamonas sp.]